MKIAICQPTLLDNFVFFEICNLNTGEISTISHCFEGNRIFCAISFFFSNFLVIVVKEGKTDEAILTKLMPGLMIKRSLITLY